MHAIVEEDVPLYKPKLSVLFWTHLPIKCYSFDITRLHTKGGQQSTMDAFVTVAALHWFGLWVWQVLHV